MIKNAPPARYDGARRGRNGTDIAESRAERRGFLFGLDEGVVCRMCHLYEHYGDLRNKATDEQNTGTDSENGNDELDIAEHERPFIEKKNKTAFSTVSSYQPERTQSR